MGAARCRAGRGGKTSFLIVDAQSVSNADTVKHKGYDGGKKGSGVKRQVGVDSRGLPHFIALPTADVTDRRGAWEGMKNHRQGLDNVQAVLGDGGYAGEAFAQEVGRLLDATVTVAKRNEWHTFSVIP